MNNPIDELATFFAKEFIDTLRKRNTVPECDLSKTENVLDVAKTMLIDHADEHGNLTDVVLGQVITILNEEDAMSKKSKKRK